jgi:hypothetical protein
MNETSKHSRKEDILYALPAGFKTIDELAKILAESDASKRRENLKSWYMAGEGLHGLPPEKREIMFAKSKDYQKYLAEIAEIDKALPQNTKAFGDSLMLYFNRLTDRERVSLEKKMKEVGDKAQADEKLMKENRDYLVQAQTHEAEIVEKGKRYDVELTRVTDYETTLKKRSTEMDALHGDLENRASELSLNAKDLKEREAAIVKQEHEYGQVAKEISDALTYAKMLKTVVGPKIEGFQTMLDEMAIYFQNALKILPNTQVPPALPPAKKVENVLMPGPDAGATMLGFGDITPKSTKPK